jgi:predicted Fe-Mo cluster-binding NifX family protein
MKIALPLVNNNKLESEISEHFGHASYFGFVEIKNKKIVGYEIVPNTFESHVICDLSKLLQQKNAEILIASEMGQRALDCFDNFNIKVITGASGKIKEIVEAYLKGELEVDESWKENQELANHDLEE